MQQNDFSDFHAVLEDCLSMWGGQPSAKVAAMWFACLSAHGLDDVRMAFVAHMRDPANGKFEPKPAHIIEQLERAEKRDGRPGVEEAWAMSISALDEYDTIIWTRECAQAWWVAKPVFDLGDEVGARMAFKEAYGRMVSEARARKEPVSWEASIGFDRDRRREVINSAIEAGRLPASMRIEAPKSDLMAIAFSNQMSPEIRKKLDDLKKSFTEKKFESNDSDRQKTMNLKKIQQEKAEAYLKNEQ